MSHSCFSFPQSWSLRAFLSRQNLQDCPSISLHPPAVQCHAFGGFASCAPVLSNSPLTLQSSLKEDDPGSPNNQNNQCDGRSDTEHLERTTGKGRWGDLQAGDGLSACGRSKELLWRWRKPLQSWVCETYWRWWGAEKRGFTIFPVKTSLMAAFPATPWMEGVSLLKRQRSPSSTHSIFQAWRAVEFHLGFSSFPLQPHLSLTKGWTCSSLTPAPGGWSCCPPRCSPAFLQTPRLAYSAVTTRCFAPLLNFAC